LFLALRIDDAIPADHMPSMRAKEWPATTLEMLEWYSWKCLLNPDR
jgi:hypothetical protein